MNRFAPQLAFIAVTAVAACKQTASNYCEDVPVTHNCLDKIDADTSCSSNAECSGATPVCDVDGSRACVECTTSEAAACVDKKPVCGDDHACRGCSAHADCAASSNVCLPDGSCAMTSEVAYVEANATGDCEKASPCGTLAAGVAKNRKYVKVTGVVNADTTTVTINRAVMILAAPNASVNVTADNVPVLSIAGSNADVSIYDLEVTGGTMTSGVGIDIPNGGTPKLSLTRVKVAANSGPGIAAAAGTLTVTQSTVSGNTGSGISSSAGSLTVTQSTISGNIGGGISVTSGTTFTITNNFIYRNGNSSTTSIGGASIVGGASNVFAFNTVVDNQIQNSGSLSAGVFCDTDGFAAPNNIIARNFVNNDPNKVNSNTGGLCTYPTSKVQPDVADLAFESPDTSPFSYKLTNGSSAIDQATTSSLIVVDFFGTTRPQRSGKDIGAHELP